jgi:hypothetical protein
MGSLCCFSGTVCSSGHTFFDIVCSLFTLVRYLLLASSCSDFELFKNPLDAILKSGIDCGAWSICTISEIVVLSTSKSTELIDVGSLVDGNTVAVEIYLEFGF